MIQWLWRNLRERVESPAVPISTPSRMASDPEGVYFEAAARFLDVQISTDDVLDNKTANAFSVGSTVLPVTFGLLALGSTNPPLAAIALLIVALFAYLVLLACAARASFIRGIEYRPHLPTLKGHSETYSGESLRRWVANEYTASTEINRALLVRKSRWVGATIAALYAEGIFLSLAAIATLL